MPRRMTDPAQALRDFRPSKEYFIGIDSDGCVFDSMEIKHKECFTPMFIKHFNLQAVSKYAREVWEFVNLYSKTRAGRKRMLFARRRIASSSQNARRKGISRIQRIGTSTIASSASGQNSTKRINHNKMTAIPIMR